MYLPIYAGSGAGLESGQGQGEAAPAATTVSCPAPSRAGSSRMSRRLQATQRLLAPGRGADTDHERRGRSRSRRPRQEHRRSACQVRRSGCGHVASSRCTGWRSSRALRPRNRISQPASQPAGFGLGRADAHAEDLAGPVGVDAGRDQHMGVDDPAAFADLQSSTRPRPRTCTARHRVRPSAEVLEVRPERSCTPVSTTFVPDRVVAVRNVTSMPPQVAVVPQCGTVCQIFGHSVG